MAATLERVSQKTEGMIVRNGVRRMIVDIPCLPTFFNQFCERLALAAEDEELDFCILCQLLSTWSPERDKIMSTMVTLSAGWLWAAFQGW
ncbi:hypothetical protein VSDG_09284 [Cytospora chrysosperma]|uniref:Uncharacterized protein n=1 Tax=Cytospora chrysosperma TaxID=252740 RepID=A0A423VBC3_CYTCH|nr:hypothetical protein VSDG_09284 [Valsa sordida]